MTLNTLANYIYKILFEKIGKLIFNEYFSGTWFFIVHLVYAKKLS